MMPVVVLMPFSQRQSESASTKKIIVCENCGRVDNDLQGCEIRFTGSWHLASDPSGLINYFRLFFFFLWPCHPAGRSQFIISLNADAVSGMMKL
jgi:hypothetical protein